MRSSKFEMEVQNWVRLTGLSGSSLTWGKLNGWFKLGKLSDLKVGLRSRNLKWMDVLK